MKSDNAIWISPDGKKIVYATFNDSQVQSVQWKLYGDGRDANVNPYPTEAFMRYPKVCTLFSNKCSFLSYETCKIIDKGTFYSEVVGEMVTIPFMWTKYFQFMAWMVDEMLIFSFFCISRINLLKAGSNMYQGYNQ